METIKGLVLYKMYLKKIFIWPWTKKLKEQAEREIVAKGFPASVRQDVFTAFDIVPLDHNIQYRFNQVIKVEYLIHPVKQSVSLNGEALELPSRVYFNEPSLEQEVQLLPIQRVILHCIYLRHHDGYVRQKRLNILLGENEDFIIPYKFSLLGEYVIEILQDLQKHITQDNIEPFVKFARQNPKYFVQLEGKMAGAWNTHYRWKSPKLRQYIGRHNIDAIKKNLCSRNRASKIDK